MSNEPNTILLEEAYEWADICVNTTQGDMLDRAIRDGDLDAVRRIVVECRELHRYDELIDSLREQNDTY